MKQSIILSLFVFALTIQAEQFSRKEWTDHLSQGLPPLMCSAKGYFLTCFSTDAAACEKLIKTNVTNCIGRLVPPKMIDTRDNGPEWAEKIGHCVGEATEKALSKLPQPPSECADPRKFL